MATGGVELLERKPVGPVPDRTGGSGTTRPRNGGDDGEPGFAADPGRFGLWLFLGTVSMLFLGFTSAYLVRRAAGDWRPLAAPPILWLNTAVLVASSVALEAGRRRDRSAGGRAALGAVAAAAGLGVLFLAGQVQAWRVLAGWGVFLSSHPHSSFFYVLSGVHLAHLVGGLVWFTAVLVALARGTGRRRLDLLATYWHYLAGLWVYLLILLFVF
jgi:cytochrome c oxidase subunit 3